MRAIKENLKKKRKKKKKKKKKKKTKKSVSLYVALICAFAFYCNWYQDVDLQNKDSTKLLVTALYDCLRVSLCSSRAPWEALRCKIFVVLKTRSSSDVFCTCYDLSLYIVIVNVCRRDCLGCLILVAMWERDTSYLGNTILSFASLLGVQRLIVHGIKGGWTGHLFLYSQLKELKIGITNEQFNDLALQSRVLAKLEVRLRNKTCLSFLSEHCSIKALK